jgi:hypothetical protein
MPITVLEQRDGMLVNRTEAAELAETSGWWNAVHAADLNGDGTSDLIAGNFGLNSRLKATPQTPVRLHRNDFDEDGQADPILTRFNNGTSYPWAGRDQLLQRFPFLKEKFPTYDAFGAAQLDDLFPPDKVREATVQTAQTFASAYVENQGDGTFSVTSLPSHAQFAPVYGMLVHDLTGSGSQDVLLGGNFHSVRPRQGRYDASYGTLLRGEGNGRWAAVPPPESNVYLQGEVRALRLLRGPGGTRHVIVARNDAQPQVIRFDTTALRSSGAAQAE